MVGLVEPVLGFKALGFRVSGSGYSAYGLIPKVFIRAGALIKVEALAGCPQL